SFFFSSRRRHTRLVSDWSSDVCSSDLALTVLEELRRDVFPPGADSIYQLGGVHRGELVDILEDIESVDRQPLGISGNDAGTFSRSEERRVGKECRSRWSRYR